MVATSCLIQSHDHHNPSRKCFWRVRRLPTYPFTWDSPQDLFRSDQTAVVAHAKSPLDKQKRTDVTLRLNDGETSSPLGNLLADSRLDARFYKLGVGVGVALMFCIKSDSTFWPVFGTCVWSNPALIFVPTIGY